MSLDSTTEELMRNLARAVARGRTVAAWARKYNISVESAQRLSELPEFRDCVEKIRLEHAERLAGKLGRKADRAVERLGELVELTDQPSVSLRAAKAIIDEWIKVTLHFIQEWKFQDLNVRMKAIVNKRNGQSSGRGYGSVVAPGARTAPVA
jgi:hypothetical protein